uniref:CobQ/CobB/MinD/ParA nucleotide binding domain-containing protein n=1 Tax=Corynebacterium glutamicum TaxID=1718 RepID=Q8VVK3_CORGT|nr:hypothetical protein [Corynebacterium glutamicum]
MSILTIAHTKGGVGKTTSAVLLCAAAHARGIAVTLIDSEAQGIATARGLAGWHAARCNRSHRQGGSRQPCGYWCAMGLRPGSGPTAPLGHQRVPVPERRPGPPHFPPSLRESRTRRRGGFPWTPGE